MYKLLQWEIKEGSKSSILNGLYEVLYCMQLTLFQFNMLNGFCLLRGNINSMSG